MSTKRIGFILCVFGFFALGSGKRHWLLMELPAPDFAIGLTALFFNDRGRLRLSLKQESGVDKAGFLGKAEKTATKVRMIYQTISSFIQDLAGWP